MEPIPGPKTKETKMLQFIDHEGNWIMINPSHITSYNAVISEALGAVMYRLRLLNGDSFIVETEHSFFKAMNG